MGKEIQVNTVTLNSDIETLTTTLSQIQKNLDKMYDAVKVLDSMWEGEANNMFNQQFASDREAMGDVCKNIQTVIDCMTYAKEQYNTCEGRVGEIVSSIRI